MVQLTHKAVALMCGFKFTKRGNDWYWIDHKGAQRGAFVCESAAAYACCIDNGLVQ